MATDARTRRRRLALPLGLVWLGLLLFVVGRLLIALVHELIRLRPVGAATLIDRMSQLKPWAWKAPQALVPLAFLLAFLVLGVVGLWIVAIRRALGRDRLDGDGEI
jgi:hypothetical protein